MKYSFFNADVFREKQLLVCFLILNKVDMSSMNFHLKIKIHNDLLIICLAHCLVINWIIKEVQAL